MIFSHIIEDLTCCRRFGQCGQTAATAVL